MLALAVIADSFVNRASAAAAKHGNLSIAGATHDF
jgi:hypothetical protein